LLAYGESFSQHCAISVFLSNLLNNTYFGVDISSKETAAKINGFVNLI
jgi:hypothetical protein